MKIRLDQLREAIREGVLLAEAGVLDDYQLNLLEINEGLLEEDMLNFEPFEHGDVPQNAAHKNLNKSILGYIDDVLNMTPPPDAEIPVFAQKFASDYFRQNPQWIMWSKDLGLSREDIQKMVTGFIEETLETGRLPVALSEAQYRGREVPLGKPMKGDTAKFKVYVKDKKTGNVKKVNFGSKEMEIRRDNPKARKSFRARHGCGTSRASDRTKAAYWSCRMWSRKPVSDIVRGK